MKITFNINYRTDWGDSLHICGNLKQLGGDDEQKAPVMELIGVDTWRLTIDVPALAGRINYTYLVIDEQANVKRREWGTPHFLECASANKNVEVVDLWSDVPVDKAYFSTAFTDGFMRRPKARKAASPKQHALTLHVLAPMVAPDETVAVCGAIPALGNWNAEKAVDMNDAAFPLWTIDIKLPDLSLGFEYKFLIRKKKSGEVVAWETGSNRYYAGVAKDVDGVKLGNLRLANPIAPWKGAGTAIPVFSLRSNDDFGAGDFVDLKLMVDWCVTTGQKVLQLLPVNDTTMTGTWLDSYPYKANSTFALHPMYIRLEEVGILKDESRRRYYEELRQELNKELNVDYERVNAAKMSYLREIFEEQRTKTLRSKEYKSFVERNKTWLLPYAAWCVLRDIYSTPDNSEWGKYAAYSSKKIASFIAENKGDIDFYCFVQYHLDKQLAGVSEYARERGVVLKGDIPIGISKTSVDAWLYPSLFNMNSQAGAPPDDFSVLGQNWGFPTYNWDKMACDGFKWWKDRFVKMQEYFDAYRIDHILGFFRIWQIPDEHIHGLLGIFNPALPLTPQEMRQAYDFHFDEELHTNPLILDWMLSDFFGNDADRAKKKFFQPVGDGRYRLKPKFDTQKKVAAYFAEEEKSEANTRLCNALMGLIDDVLFIIDPYEKGKYHPRIAAHYTYQYRCLSDYEKWCFDRLYNDFFYHRNEEFWKEKALWKLPALIDSTGMLACAEDLGMIPACVPEVMSRLQILSLEIQRMPKDSKVMFGDPQRYPYLSVCTTSTHDMPGIRTWWESNRDTTQRFYNEVLHDGGTAPYFAEPWICDRILRMHLDSPSMLCIIPLQDWLSADAGLRRNDPREEQINEPANPHHYWRYRMHISLEKLNAEFDFNNSLRSAIKSSGR